MRNKRCFCRHFTLAAVGLFAAVVAHAQATFTLKDSTNLKPGTYKIYYTGYSTAGPYVLQSDGSWATPSQVTTSTALPCYEFKKDQSQVQISGTYAGISARVYYFIVTDLTAFPNCNPTSSQTGLFGDGLAFTYTYTTPPKGTGPVMAVNVPPASDVVGQLFPAWTYSEIGASATSGTIDLSQVDFFAFPMHTTAPVTSGPGKIGNPVGSDNAGDAVNHASIRDSYKRYVNALAEAQNGNQSCAQDSTPSVCAYLELLQTVTTSNSAVPLYVIQNPGGFTIINTTSRLNKVFDGVINALWSTGASPLQINTGGALGGVAQDTFVSSIVTIAFPAVPAITYQVKAMKFVGKSTHYIAYVFSPKDYQDGCNSGSIPVAYCSSPATTGYQVFADAGALVGPLVPADTFNALQAAGHLQAGVTSSSDYAAVVARLGFLISGAMNRGVALVDCKTATTPPAALDTWKCWQDETYWYPTATSTTYPDITQNLFSRWMHTASIGGTPMFVQPPGAVQSAGGKTMGMAYGIANDENPTPPATAVVQPEVPSKFDSTVSFTATGDYTITFGPWVTVPQLNPTLTVVIFGGAGGTVTSSPSGIQCEPSCSHAYPPGTSITLTATPDHAHDFVFFQWTGACSGHRSTCTVVLNDSTTVTAEFGQIAATQPVSKGLHVIVSGPGNVTSSPAGIDCGTASCSAAFPLNAMVTLTAAPSAGATFKSWTGACAGSGATCTVTMSAGKTVGATFVTPAQFALTVQGGAGGIVTTTPSGIDCGTTCVAGFAAGAAVGVVAQPNPGFRFAGWSGACGGTNTCDLVMDGDKTVSASFTSVPLGQYALTAHDVGEGTVTSTPPGISCGSACAAAFPAGTQVLLSVSPNPGYVFAGWTGACTGFGMCIVYMDDLQNVTATFTAAVVGPTTLEPVPTLSEWALFVMCMLIVLVAATQRKRMARLERRE